MPIFEQSIVPNNITECQTSTSSTRCEARRGWLSIREEGELKAILQMRIEKEVFGSDHSIDNGQPFGVLVMKVSVEIQLKYLFIKLTSMRRKSSNYNCASVLSPYFSCINFIIAQRLHHLNRTFKVSLRGECDW
jgi:hypothetical protein